MITDARAQVDLIAALHLDALFKMGHLENLSDQSIVAAKEDTDRRHVW
jgi:hypothetical protein